MIGVALHHCPYPASSGPLKVIGFRSWLMIVSIEGDSRSRAGGKFAKFELGKGDELQQREARALRQRQASDVIEQLLARIG